MMTKFKSAQRQLTALVGALLFTTVLVVASAPAVPLA